MHTRCDERLQSQWSNCVDALKKERCNSNFPVRTVNKKNKKINILMESTGTNLVAKVEFYTKTTAKHEGHYVEKISLEISIFNKCNFNIHPWRPLLNFRNHQSLPKTETLVAFSIKHVIKVKTCDKAQLFVMDRRQATSVQKTLNVPLRWQRNTSHFLLRYCDNSWRHRRVLDRRQWLASVNTACLILADIRVHQDFCSCWYIWRCRICCTYHRSSDIGIQCLELTNKPSYTVFCVAAQPFAVLCIQGAGNIISAFVCKITKKNMLAYIHFVLSLPSCYLTALVEKTHVIAM